jgi:hypothetical protein
LATPSASSAFRGFIREFALYNETLSAADAQALVESAPPNSAPYVASPTTVSTNEDVYTVLPLGLRDFDGDPISVTITTLPMRGILFVNGTALSVTPVTFSVPQTIAFQTNTNDVATAVFRVGCTDSRGARGRETEISILVTPVNDAPVPVSRTVSVARRA